MIWLFNSKNRPVGSYKTFDELMEHLNRLENLKSWNPEKCHEEEKWSFVFTSHRRLKVLHDHLKSISFTDIENEAYENELDLVEIYTGDPQHPEQIFVTSEVDLQNLIKEWCFDYCYRHRYTILESLNGNLNLERSTKKSQEYFPHYTFPKDKILPIS